MPNKPPAIKSENGFIRMKKLRMTSVKKAIVNRRLKVKTVLNGYVLAEMTGEEVNFSWTMLSLAGDLVILARHFINFIAAYTAPATLINTVRKIQMLKEVFAGVNKVKPMNVVNKSAGSFSP